MQTISLCMIVRDEEAVLERCLSSVADLVEEIIIVDTGSTDYTREIAARYTNQIYDFVWNDDFAAARNASFARATMDYCFWLDADDVLTEENRRQLQALKASLDGTADVIFLPYWVGPEGRADSIVYYRERLLRRAAGFVWQGRVHEAIAPAGKLQYSQAAIQHCPQKSERSTRNLDIYEAMLTNGEQLNLREQYYYGRELYSHQRFAEAAEIFSRYLQQPDGWCVNQVDACRLLAVCYSNLQAPKQQLTALLQAFCYDVPDGGLCCDLGAYFLEHGREQQAVYWYEQAMRCTPRLEQGGFVQQAVYDYIPHLQLCVCYDRLGNREMAELHNELAAMAMPDSAAVAYNRAYFLQKS